MVLGGRREKREDEREEGKREKRENREGEREEGKIAKRDREMVRENRVRA